MKKKNNRIATTFAMRTKCECTRRQCAYKECLCRGVRSFEYYWNNLRCSFQRKFSLGISCWIWFRIHKQHLYFLWQNVYTWIYCTFRAELFSGRKEAQLGTWCGFDAGFYNNHDIALEPWYNRKTPGNTEQIGLDC